MIEHVTSYIIPGDLNAQLEKQAAAEGLSKGEVMRRALRMYLAVKQSE